MPMDEVLGGRCPKPDCDFGSTLKIVKQCTDINVPFEIKPSAEVGRIDTDFHFDPVIECTQAGKDCCEVLVTQKVCVKVPITFKVKTCSGPEFVVCCTKPHEEKE